MQFGCFLYANYSIWFIFEICLYDVVLGILAVMITTHNDVLYIPLNMVKRLTFSV